MIKRLIAALSMLVFCVLICVASFIVINNLTGKVIESLKETVTAVENNDIEKAKNTIEEAEEKWDKYKPVFDIFLDHSLLEDLSVNLPSIKPFLKNESFEAAKEKLEESIYALEGVIDEQRISIGNIL